MKNTVSNAAFVHKEDVNPDKHIDAKRMDATMITAANCAASALDEAAGEYTDFQRGVMGASLKSAVASHSTMRAVLKTGHEDPMSVDALALARIPLETLYNICLFTESPVWVRWYLRDDWKKQYVQFLLQREETRNLPRFSEYAKVGLRHLMESGERVGITREEIDAIDREQLGTPTGSDREHKIEPFPTPGKAMQSLRKGSDKRRMLERLYYEYIFLCSFTHGLPTASMFKTMFDSTSPSRRFRSEDEWAYTHHKTVATTAYFASRLGVVQASAEIAVLYPKNVELRATLVTAWDEMSKDSLLGRAVWHLRAEKLLGVVE